VLNPFTVKNKQNKKAVFYWLFHFLKAFLIDLKREALQSYVSRYSLKSFPHSPPNPKIIHSNPINKDSAWQGSKYHLLLLLLYCRDLNPGPTP
jgi:hypothetical protein